MSAVFAPVLRAFSVSYRVLEVSLTLRVAAIAVQLNRIAGAFAGSAAVFAILLRRASARRVLAFFFVSHFSSAPL